MLLVVLRSYHNDVMFHNQNDVFVSCSNHHEFLRVKRDLYIPTVPSSFGTFISMTLLCMDLHPLLFSFQENLDGPWGVSIPSVAQYVKFYPTSSMQEIFARSLASVITKVIRRNTLLPSWTARSLFSSQFFWVTFFARPRPEEENSS